MHIPPIAWGDFTWEAFSTLAAGALTVGAAWWVGSRQMQISKRQAEIADQQRMILAKQAYVDEFRLKSELFELRHAVYESAKALLVKIMTTGYPIEKEVEREFLIGLDQSKFLFRPAVEEGLSELWSKSCHKEANKKVMEHNFATRGDYGAEQIEIEYRSSLWMDERLRSLGDLFGDELKLGEAASPQKSPADLTADGAPQTQS